MNKLERKRLKKNYLKEDKFIEKDGFIFDAIGGFGDWGADLSEKETLSYMCDTSSPMDIKRWFDEVIYPGTTQLPGSSKEKLIEFIDLYEENKTNQIIRGIHTSMVSSALIKFEKNQNVFFQTLAKLITEKLDNI